MDTLLVFRRPLAPAESKIKFIKPVKPKFVTSKLSSRSISISQTSSDEDKARPEHNISFVKLYEELCSKKDGRHHSTPNSDVTTASHTRANSSTAKSVLSSGSYLARDDSKDYPPFGKRNIRAQVVLEISYDRKTEE